MQILYMLIIYTSFFGVRVLPPVWEQCIKHTPAQENMLAGNISQ